MDIVVPEELMVVLNLEVGVAVFEVIDLVLFTGIAVFERNVVV
jgi:hypothetical protein